MPEPIEVALTVEDLQGPFYMMAFLITVCVFTFMMELLLYRISNVKSKATKNDEYERNWSNRRHHGVVVTR